MEIKEQDFNYYIEDGKYYFYFLSYSGKILYMNMYNHFSDPMSVMRLLTLNGMRYNPYLNRD